MWLLRPMALAVAVLTMVASVPPRAQPASSTAPAPPAAPATPPAAAPPAGQPADAFGEEVTLAAKPIIYLKGTATWDTAFDTLVDAFKSVQGFVDREKQDRKSTRLNSSH